MKELYSLIKLLCPLLYIFFRQETTPEMIDCYAFVFYYIQILFQGYDFLFESKKFREEIFSALPIQSVCSHGFFLWAVSKKV